MIRKLLPPVLVVIAILLDFTVIPEFLQSAYLPLLTLVLVHALGLTLGRSRGALFGLIAGILVDISVSTPLGLMTVVATALGYLGGFFVRRVRRSPWWGVFSAALGFVGAELILNFYVILASGQISAGLLLAALIRVGLDILCVQAACFVLDRLLRPSRSPYAAV